MRLRILLTAFVLTMTFTTLASAQRDRGLEVGSPAPGLDVEWVKRII